MVATHGPTASSASQLSDYDYVRTLTRSRIAWEYLRRHPDYGRDWRTCIRERPRKFMLKDGTVMLQARRSSRRAEAWGLCTFRRSRQKCA